MSSGVARLQVGAITPAGTAYDVRTVGFRPKKVELINVDGLVYAQWNNTMPDDSAALRITDGTISYITSDGITPLSDGFTIGANANVNVDGEEIHWTAWE
jgi:hypothetical protein